MDATRWEHVQAIFHGAVELPLPERQAFVADACEDDSVLFSAVIELLEEDARGGSLLDGEVAHVAEQLLSEPDVASLPVDRVGRYAIKRRLGEGGMGVVYLAEREDLGSLVALKILRDAWVSPARRERFTIEQRMLAQLNHPFIARIYDADALPDGTPWFAMEHVEGRSLTEYLQRAEQHHPRASAVVPRRLSGCPARPPAADRAPGSEAVEHPGDRERHSETPRLRDCETARDAGWIGRRYPNARPAHDARLCRTRADPRRAGGSADRRLCARRRPVPSSSRDGVRSSSPIGPRARRRRSSSNERRKGLRWSTGRHHVRCPLGIRRGRIWTCSA